MEFGYPTRFLNVQEKAWDSVILSSDIKRQIRANTVDFLDRKALWPRYGIPVKRGVLLCGKPGTGKTIICQALMAEAKGITCIAVRADTLEMGMAILDLYAMAEDLKPSLLLEYIDIVGKKRDEFGIREPALVCLLSAMDGLVETDEIVTVATTNYLELLDEAIKQRPARFDRVIHLGLPNLEQRKELVRLLSRQIPLNADTQDYIAKHTEGLTPAQVQEVVYSLIIEQAEPMEGRDNDCLNFPPGVIESVILRLSCTLKKPLGFVKPDLGCFPSEVVRESGG